MKFVAFVAWAAAFSCCTPAHAQGSLRCDGDLAQIRDSKAVMLQKCGEPFFTESFCKPTDQIFLPCQLVEEWAYNPGPGQFITILRFEAGLVRSIRYGDRVK